MYMRLTLANSPDLQATTHLGSCNLTGCTNPAIHSSHWCSPFRPTSLTRVATVKKMCLLQVSSISSWGKCDAHKHAAPYG